MPPEAWLSFVSWFFVTGCGLGFVAVCVWGVITKRDRDLWCPMPSQWSPVCSQSGEISQPLSPDRCQNGESVKALEQAPWQQAPRRHLLPGLGLSQVASVLRTLYRERSFQGDPHSRPSPCASTALPALGSRHTTLSQLGLDPKSFTQTLPQ